MTVTHRVPMMRMWDMLLVLGDGVVRETGSYEELMGAQLEGRVCDTLNIISRNAHWSW